MCVTVESLCCISETNIMCINCTSVKKNKSTSPIGPTKQMNMRTSIHLKYYLIICSSSDCSKYEEDH